MSNAEYTDANTLFGDSVRRHGCMIGAVLLLCVPLSLCTWLRWYEPRHALPAGLEWTEIIGFGSQAGLREGCSFGAYRLSPNAIAAFKNGTPPHVYQDVGNGKSYPVIWSRTPLRIEEYQYAYVGPQQEKINLYALGANACGTEKLTRMGMGSLLWRALQTEGNWYYIFNNGEGLVVVDTHDSLAWFSYNG